MIIERGSSSVSGQLVCVVSSFLSIISIQQACLFSESKTMSETVSRSSRGVRRIDSITVCALGLYYSYSYT
jgi:hypothetical protein